MEVADMFDHGTYLTRTGEGNDLGSDWVAATANEDIGMLRDGLLLVFMDCHDANLVSKM